MKSKHIRIDSDINRILRVLFFLGHPLYIDINSGNRGIISSSLHSIINDIPSSGTEKVFKSFSLTQCRSVIGLFNTNTMLYPEHKQLVLYETL